MTQVSAGETIGGRYERTREIARGGMGSVFQAVHKVTGRVVAIKCIRENAGQATAELTARLIREGKALGRIRHPGVVDILDAGACPKVGAFLAMEMLEGRPLDGILTARRRLGLVETLGVAAAVGSALRAGHRVGVVHRDVKPANIFITRSALGEGIKLIDYGIAKMESAAEAENRITRAGDLMGTLDYMSPEQISAIERADERSDQYSLAVVIYECLTGELPNLSSRLLQSTYEPKSLAETIDAPPRIAAALVRAMNPNASARFPTMVEFLKLLTLPDGRVVPIASLLSPSMARSAPNDAATAPPQPATRRKHARSAYVTPCRIVRAAGNHLDGRTEDIAEGGMLVLVEDLGSVPLAAGGEEVSVKFALPTGGRLVNQRARIRWVKDTRGRAAIGVEFEAPEPKTVASIATYVRLIGAAAA